MKKKLIGLSLNFDWISSVTEIQKSINIDKIDKLLCEETDDVLQYISEKGGRVSIFVIGKDLERPVIKKYIKKWFNEGHEIGNHSWSHPVNLGSLSYKRIFDEVYKTELLIQEIIGKKSNGFISPSWSYSKKLAKALIKNDFQYDHSIMPSIQNILTRSAMALKSRKRKESFFKVFSIKLAFFNLFLPSKPHIVSYEEGKILELPTPSLFKTISYWYTPELLVRYFSKIKYKFLDKDGSYIIFHPADYCSFELIPEYKELFSQSKLTKTEREEYFFSYIDELFSSGRTLTTMKNLSESINSID